MANASTDEDANWCPKHLEELPQCNGSDCENFIASAMVLLMVMAISLAMAMALVAQLLSHHSSVGSSGQ